jgi:hypothetical protein
MDSKIIYHKYKNTKINKIYEIILQWHLITSRFRDVALVSLSDSEKLKLEKIIKFLEKNNISYHFCNNNNYLILYNAKKFNIDKLDKTFGKKFGKQVGDFYNCATNDPSKNKYRVVISVNSVELLAQMGKKNMIIANISKYDDIYLKIMKIFDKLDKNIFGKLETYEVQP